MVYTFLIARTGTPIAHLSKVRTRSVFAKNETQAREALAPMPLIFLSRTPARRAS
ncbi:hypothetical protein [Paraferrimonas sedimenticola]|uniref:hypothetical protein n=1 Tax=Paraferrimonas sedimenticola TaxID=375674 RepID=UPI0014735651|nr:hypothetical protein [Paraferrimonas sedimenticola]